MAETENTDLSPDVFRAGVDSGIESIQALRASLAGRAIRTAAEKEAIRVAAEALLEAATDLANTVDDLTEDKEPFGGTESYWTVFRFFTSERNRFQPISIDEVWKHLAKNYDVTLEDPQTIKDTLLDWAHDIENDARERLGIGGFFEEFEGKLVFSERDTGNLAPAKVPAPVPAPPARPVEVKSQLPRVEERADENDIAGYIVNILSALENGAAPQPDVKRALIAKYRGVSPERLQAIINDMVAAGKLQKTRSDKVSQLSLPRQAVVEAELPSDTRAEAAGEALAFDMEVKLLSELSAPGTHVQQTRTPEELARAIFNVSKGEKASEEMLDAVRKACRRLQRIGIMDGGRQKIGTGGSKTKSATSSTRRRSASNEVFKVGLVSQHVKEQIRALIESGEIETYLNEQTTYLR
jgi:hypothetical protein